MPGYVQDPDVLIDPWFMRTKLMWKFATNKTARKEMIRRSRKRLHKWWFYDPKPYASAFAMYVVFMAFGMWLTNTRIFKIFFRIPTNDINTLIHEDYYLTERNKSAERADNLSKLMKDSNYFNALKGEKKAEQTRSE